MRVQENITEVLKEEHTSRNIRWEIATIYLLKNLQLVKEDLIERKYFDDILSVALF